MKFSIKDFSSKCDRIRRKLRIWSHLLKKSSMENLDFCAVGVKKSRRVTDIKAVRENFVTSINVCNSKDKLFLASYHWFPQLYGSDTVITFSGRGKAKPLKLMTKSLRFTEAFSMFGKEITLPDLLVKTLKMFVCHMYGWKENNIVNVRYRMYCKSGGKISCGVLTSCNDALKLHASRANY